jgi:hypothetical protein
MGAAQPKESLH